jgi:hypothetical protein
MVEQLIVNFLTTILGAVTAGATSFSAFITKHERSTKSNNYKQKLEATLELCMNEYRSQVHTLKEIFRIENINNGSKLLKDVETVNDLEIKSYLENLIVLTEKAINTYIENSDYNIQSDEMSKLLSFSSLLNNFFSITNMVKEKAHDVSGDTPVTVSQYWEELIADVPPFLRKECGGLDADFSRFIEKLNNKIEGDWSDIQEMLGVSEKRE